MRQSNKYAFDKSLRHFDADGRLHVEKSHISKATVNPYMGKEIPGYEDLGLDGEKVYMLFRDPEELKAGAPTFANLPILSQHVPVNSEEPRQDLTVGTIGSNVEFEAPYLSADLCIWEAEAIKRIEDDQVRELSCAYRYVPVMEPGKYQGEFYDGRMTKIEGNHLALVENGRAGSDVVVADSNPFYRMENMNMTKIGRALYASLSAASPKLAMDAKLGAVVGAVRRKGLDAKKLKGQIMAMDVDLAPEKLDAILDAVIGVNDNPEAVDEDPAATPEKSPEAIIPATSEAEDDGASKIHELLDGKVSPEVVDAICAMIAPKPAEDEFPDKGEKKDGEMAKKEEMKGAMDAAAVRKSVLGSIQDTLAAKEIGETLCGKIVVDLATDSAEDIYGKVLALKGIDIKGHPKSAYRSMVQMLAAQAAKQPIAMDARPSPADLKETPFAHLGNIKIG